MTDYQLTATDAFVLRTADQCWIPNEPAHRYWIEYQDWLTSGGVPDPYVPPEPVPSEAAPETTVLYDHENRLRTLEGQPPLTLADFITKQRKK